MDIDKLYLNTYNYTVKDGKASKDVDSEDQRLQNELLDMYMTLLKDAGKQIDGEWTMGKYMQILHRPIDNDTQLIENVLHTIEGKDNSRTEETMMFGSLNTQVDIKNSFITGKMGIGPFALNNNSQILTQLYHVAFKNKSGDILTELNATRLDNYRDRDGKSIMSWLSALINAHVDVAKDPYILRLNVNKYTWNIVNLLVRTGFGKDSFYFINQPIFKKLALEYENANGDIVEDPGMSPTERTRAAIRKYMMSIDFGRENNDMVDAMTDENTSIEDINAINAANMDIYKELFNIDKDGNYRGGKSLLEDLITNPKYRKDPSKPVSMENLSTEPLIKIGDNRFSPLELQMYAFFAKQQFDVHAQELSDVVQYTKIDTKKHGISRQEQRDYMARYNSIYRSAQDGSGPFNEGLYRMLSESFIDTKTRNAISLLLDILGKEMIHYTPTFEKGVQMICDEVNSQRAVTKKEASKALYTYIKQKCMNVYMRENGISFRDMITGDNSLASRIIALKAKMMTDNTGKYSEFVTNGIMTNNLLANLSRVHYNAPYGYEQYDVVALENTEQDDNEIKDGYIDDWLLLWEFEDEEVRQIAHDLAIYAFMTSGDNAGFTKFFKYVPLDIREYIGYTQYMEDMKNAFMDGNITFNEDIPYGMFNIDIDEILRNNWKNNNLIPVTNLWRESRSGRKQLSAIGKYLEYDEVKDGETLNRKDVFKIFAGQYGAISKCRTTGEFPKFIKIRRPKTNKLSADQYILYKLIGTGKTTFIGKDKKQHVTTYPVYGLTYPKGFDVYSGSQRYTFYENDRRDGYKHLFDENYATSPEYLNAMWRAILNFLSFIDENTDVVQESAIKAMLDDANTDIFSEEMKEFYQDSALKQIIRDIYRYGGLPTDAEAYDNVNEAYEIGRTADIDKETGSVGYYDEFGVEGERSVISLQDNYSRESVANDPTTLYIFTDNTDRTSGGQLYGDGWYKLKYGEGGFGSTKNPTTAQIRGLDNAAPISTMKYFYRLHGGMSVADARWTDADIEEFKKTIDSEIEDIKKLWDSGKFKRVVYPGGDGFFNSKIAQINRDSEIGKYLDSKLLELENYLLNNQQNNQTQFDISSAEFYSGAAKGSDTEWATQARALGIKVKEYTPADFDSLSEEWKQRLDLEYKEVVEELGRKELSIDTYAGKLVRRDMMQADKADAVFAIVSSFDGSIPGGTAYAATRAWQRGIPVYVFNQSIGLWYDYDTLDEIDIPVLTQHAAVIGTREINNAGIQAIKDVLNKTVGLNDQSNEFNNSSEFPTDEMNHCKH